MIEEHVKAGLAQPKNFVTGKLGLGGLVSLAFGTAVLLLTCWLVFRIIVSGSGDLTGAVIDVLFIVMYGSLFAIPLVVLPFTKSNLPTEKAPPLAGETPHGDAGLASWNEATRALQGDTDWQKD